jgi:hypothetical protein
MSLVYLGRYVLCRVLVLGTYIDCMIFTFGLSPWFMKYKAWVISIISFVNMLCLGEGRIPRSLLVTLIIFFFVKVTAKDIFP